MNQNHWTAIVVLGGIAAGFFIASLHDNGVGAKIWNNGYNFTVVTP